MTYSLAVDIGGTFTDLALFEDGGGAALTHKLLTTPADPAEAVIEGIRAIDPKLVLMGLAGAQVLAQAAKAGLKTVAEAFADRAYTPQGTLVSRREAGAVLHDPELIAARMLRLATDGVIEAADGSTLQLQADSICVHGDSPGAVAISARIRQVLLEGGVEIAPFAGAGA